LYQLVFKNTFRVLKEDFFTIISEDIIYIYLLVGILVISSLSFLIKVFSKIKYIFM